MVENPWNAKMRAIPGFGEVDAKAEKLFRAVSADPDEELIASIHITHGLGRVGYLVLTNHWLRWLQSFPRKDEFWPLLTVMERVGMGTSSLLRLETGDQFQTRGLTGGKLKSFHELFTAAQQSLIWEERNAGATPAPSGAGEGVASELARLGELRDNGTISDVEFDAAKKKLLGL